MPVDKSNGHVKGGGKVEFRRCGLSVNLNRKIVHGYNPIWMVVEGGASDSIKADQEKK